MSLECLSAVEAAEYLGKLFGAFPAKEVLEDDFGLNVGVIFHYIHKDHLNLNPIEACFAVSEDLKAVVAGVLMTAVVKAEAPVGGVLGGGDGGEVLVGKRYLASKCFEYAKAAKEFDSFFVRIDAEFGLARDWVHRVLAAGYEVRMAFLSPLAIEQSWFNGGNEKTATRLFIASNFMGGSGSPVATCLEGGEA